MLIVSVGTGTSPQASDNLGASDMNLLYKAQPLASALMYPALNEQDLLCRTFGKCLCGEALDSELGDLVDSTGELLGPVAAPLFTYLRYNTELTRPGLDRLGLSNVKSDQLQKLDSVKHIENPREVGRAVGSERVSASHLDGFC